MIFKQQKAHSALSVQHQSLSKKAIKNCIAMWRNYTYYQVFQKWKLETRHHQIVKEKLTTSVFLRLQHRTCHNAFTFWRRNLHLKEEKDRLFSISIEVENEQIQQDKIKKSRTQLAKTRDATNFQMVHLEQETNYAHRKIRNQIDRLISEKRDNFIISRKEHIF